MGGLKREREREGRMEGVRGAKEREIGKDGGSAGGLKRERGKGGNVVG